MIHDEPLSLSLSQQKNILFVGGREGKFCLTSAPLFTFITLNLAIYF